jgi:subtilase family serine protease
MYSKNTRISLRTIVSVLLLAGIAGSQASTAGTPDQQEASASGAVAPNDGRQRLTGHLTPEIQQTQIVGRIERDTELTLTVALPIRNGSGLDEMVEAVSDPGSDSYQKYLSPDQFGDMFGASPQDYDAVLAWGRAHNLSVTPHQNRFVVTVVGAAADIEEALKIHLNYRLRADGTLFFAPDAEPSLDLAVPVEHISGLQDFRLPQHAGGSGAGGTYQGSDFRNAYAGTMTLNGAGQKVGIFMLDGFAQSDVNAYAKMVGDTFQPVEVVKTVSGPLTPGLEGSLDVETVLAIAPAAQVVTFVGTVPTATTMLTDMTERTDIKQFSSSWFWYDGTTADNNLMKQLATQGQSFFQATGDGGAYEPPQWPTATSGSMDDRQFTDIVLVGGTGLEMADHGKDYGSLETAWPGSSGGIIVSEGLPSYQKGIAGHNGASKTHRNVPDVAAAAAVDTTIIFKGAQVVVGGTSEAAPMWAGFTALANQLGASGEAPSVGFPNPKLYEIASTKAYATNFNDIVAGCNLNSKGFEYCAGDGYDLVTGLGSPKRDLIYALSGVQSYPLYCKGPLVTKSGLTSFKWAKTGAGAASPGPGECAWADRAPTGTEIKAGDSNEIAGNIGEVANLPAGKYAEIGVFNDPHTHDMNATQIVGFVKPPFSSVPSLP